MNRGLSLSLCAVAVAAVCASNALAVISTSLNLRYDDPANEAAGGSWTLVAKTDGTGSTQATQGIAALVVDVDNVDNGGTVAAPEITTAADINAIYPIDAGGANERVNYLANGPQTEYTYGQDISADPVTTGVGTASHPSNVASDVFGNSAWDNVTVIATGSFGGSRPAITDADGNELTATASPWSAEDDGATVFATRGDGVASDGLLTGDADRSGTVDVADLGILATNWQSTAAGWDDGNFTGTQNDTNVDVADLGELATNWQLSRTPPASAAAAGVPEPTSVVLTLLGGSLLLVSRRK